MGEGYEAKGNKYVIGVDYGTLSARAVLVSVGSGEVMAESIYAYPHGILRRLGETAAGVISEGEAPVGVRGDLPADFALQKIDDYEEALYDTIGAVVRKSGCRAEDVIGIGIDATSSTFLPLSENGEPLCRVEGFRTNPHAQLKLWKHHGACK